MTLIRTSWVAAAAVTACLMGNTAWAQNSCQGKTEPIRFAGITWESGQFYTELLRTVVDKGFGCKTEVVNGSTAATETALVSGDLQVWTEQWNRTDIIKKGQEMGKINLVGDLLKGGSYEGFFVPDYVVNGDAKRGIKASAPQLKSVADLPKYKALFQDDEDPSKGRLLSCPVGWDCEKINTQKLKAYKLDADYTNFRAGTGAALDAAISSAVERGKPILFYYWSPASLMGKYKFVQLQEPAYNEKCWETVRKPEVKDPCPSATPAQRLTVGVGTAFAKSHPDLVQFFEKVQLNGEQVNSAILRMNEKKLSGEAVAKEFLKANPQLLASWVSPAIATRVQAAIK